MVCKCVCEGDTETERREAARDGERSGKARYGGIRPYECSLNLGKGQRVENCCISPSNDLS